MSGSAEMPKIGARESAVGVGHAARGEQLLMVARWCAAARLLTLLMQWPGGEQNTGGATARPAHPALTGCRAENSKLLSKLNHEYMDLHNTHCTFHINVVEG